MILEGIGFILIISFITTFIYFWFVSWLAEKESKNVLQDEKDKRIDELVMDLADSEISLHRLEKEHSKCFEFRENAKLKMAEEEKEYYDLLADRDKLKEELERFNTTRMIELENEVERLSAEAGYYGAKDTIDQLVAQRDAFMDQATVWQKDAEASAAETKQLLVRIAEIETFLIYLQTYPIEMIKDKDTVLHDIVSQFCQLLERR